MLKEKIIQRIKNSGPIPVDQFMGQAVQYYYENMNPFGQSGDFITAPEVSQLFGEVIGAWVVDCWVKLGAPKNWHLVEVGPGRGVLMADMLRMITKLPECSAGMDIALIEQSQSLSSIQREAIERFDLKAQWCNTIQDLNLSGPIIIIGNEFLDALPIKQYVVSADKKYERHVDWSEETGLVFREIEQSKANLKSKEKGVIEESPAREAFINDVSDLISKYSGVALMIDYGHAKSSVGDTLQAVKAHQYVDVLDDNLGEADITSHVDFEALKQAAITKNMHVENIVSQGHFLKQIGITIRAAKINAPAKDVARLIDANQMGQLFKVMCFSDKHYGVQGFL